MENGSFINISFITFLHVSLIIKICSYCVDGVGNILTHLAIRIFIYFQSYILPLLEKHFFQMRKKVCRAIEKQPYVLLKISKEYSIIDETILFTLLN